jgi:hypothetical protein
MERGARDERDEREEGKEYDEKRRQLESEWDICRP